MAYATAEELADYVADNLAVEVPSDEDAVERLLERGERAVDLVVGPWPRFSTGLKFDPPSLDLTQQQALSRATCAYVEWLLLVGPEFEAGDADVMSGALQVVSRTARQPPKLLAELAGHGLIRYSGTVSPTPAVVVIP